MEDKTECTTKVASIINKTYTSIDNIHNKTSRTVSFSTLSVSKDNICGRPGSKRNKKPEKIVLRFSRSVSDQGEHFNDILEHKMKTFPKSNLVKNEAEIIDDLPINQVHSSNPVISGIDSLVGASRNCSTTKSRGQRQRRGSISESLDSDLRSLRRNSIEGRRFQKAVIELDRQSSAGVLELQQKINEVFKDYNRIVQRSPTADEWLRLKKSRKNSLQEREREIIAKRYSRRERQFRAHPDLLGAVSRIRAHAMMEAGLQLDSETDELARNGLVPAMESLNLSRRHSISGELHDTNLPQISKLQTQKSGFFYGRRMTLADTRIHQNILELKADRMLKLYVDSFLNRKIEVNDLEQHSTVDCPHTKSNEEITIKEIK